MAVTSHRFVHTTEHRQNTRRELTRRAAGRRPLKRSLLLHGPPGTGTTLSVMYPCSEPFEKAGPAQVAVGGWFAYGGPD